MNIPKSVDGYLYKNQPKRNKKMYYFIRVNAHTVHNNPHTKCYIEGEPPLYPDTFINYLHHCFVHNIIRIGWPGVGDLRLLNKALPPVECYKFGELKPHIRRYLTDFLEIPIGSIVLVPDKMNPGDLYICEVIGEYNYFYAPPNYPFECAHQLAVRWDRDTFGKTISYSANQLGISIRGGFWMRAFQKMEQVKNFEEIVEKCTIARRDSGWFASFEMDF
jgi:hypothetical protein